MIPLETLNLETLTVAKPCHANWDAMTGDAQVRFCGDCRKNVYNLSAMTRPEAEALVLETEGRACVRFYTRPDGTMLTQDCPVGLRAMRQKLARKLASAAVVALSCAAGLLRPFGTAQAANMTVPKNAAPPKTSPKASPKTSPKTTPPGQWTAGAPVTPATILQGRIGTAPTMGKPLPPCPPPHAKK